MDGDRSLLSLCSIAFSLIVLESIASLSERAPGNVAIDGSVYAEKPDLGWGPGRAGTFAVTKTGPDSHVIYKTAYTIDADLIRETTSEPGQRPVVFIGDSFTFGEGVSDADTMPQAFADLTDRKIPVLNLGYSGYGPSQPLRALQVGLFDKQLGKPRAFVLLTSAWHAERTGCLAGFSLRGPRYTWDGHELSYRGRCASPWQMYWRAWLDRTVFYRVFLASHFDPQPTDADFETYARIVGAIAQEVHRRYGAPLIVFYLESPEYLGKNRAIDTKVEGELKAFGADVVEAALPPDPALIIAGDGHPTPPAHRMRAQILYDYLQKNDPAILEP